MRYSISHALLITPVALVMAFTIPSDCVKEAFCHHPGAHKLTGIEMDEVRPRMVESEGKDRQDNRDDSIATGEGGKFWPWMQELRTNSLNDAGEQVPIESQSFRTEGQFWPWLLELQPDHSGDVEADGRFWPWLQELQGQEPDSGDVHDRD